MVLKYTRNRSTIPAVMMQQLVTDLKDAFAPKCVSKDDIIDEGEDDLLPIAEFFLKIPDGSASSYEYKYHCSSKSDYQIVACGRLSADECVHVGHLLPDPGLLCKHCATWRIVRGKN